MTAFIFILGGSGGRCHIAWDSAGSSLDSNLELRDSVGFITWIKYIV